MPKTIDNYTSRAEIEAFKKKAFTVWGVVLFLVSAWAFLIVLAPLAMGAGLSGISAPIYNFYSFICHQLPSRSFHIVGHQFGVCSRCFGVYFGLVIGLLAYPLFRSIDDFQPLPRVWLFLSMIPMAIDWSLGFFDVWENNHVSRVSTGLILGIACSVFIVPALVELSNMALAKQRKHKAA